MLALSFSRLAEKLENAFLLGVLDQLRDVVIVVTARLQRSSSSTSSRCRSSLHLLRLHLLNQHLELLRAHPLQTRRQHLVRRLHRRGTGHHKGVGVDRGLDFGGAKVDDGAVVVIDGDLVDAWDLVHAQTLEGRLEALVVSRGGLVDGLLLAVKFFCVVLFRSEGEKKKKKKKKRGGRVRVREIGIVESRRRRRSRLFSSSSSSSSLLLFARGSFFVSDYRSLRARILVHLAGEREREERERVRSLSSLLFS